MAALDLTDRAAVLSYLTSQLPDDDSAALEALLDASAATDKDDCDDDAEEAVTTYRPWWIIANALQANPVQYERLASAAGSSVAYRDPVSAYRALMRRQAALDASYCTIPEGFEATIPGGVGTAAMTRTYG